MNTNNLILNPPKKLYTILCRTHWNPMFTGILIALLSVAIVAWMRPWGIVGGLRNWGGWLIYFSGNTEAVPREAWSFSSPVILLGFLAGSFISACLGNEFAIRMPPLYEALKGIVAGCLMGIGAALAGGCNVGAMYGAIANLSAHGFAMWAGIIIGVIAGLKWLYWEIEHISWGNEGSAMINFSSGVKTLLGLAALIAVIWSAYNYTGSDSNYLSRLGGLLLIASTIGYAMQRGHWCMLKGFRDPHMTGDSTYARSMAVSILVYAAGVAILKATGLAGEGLFVRGTFGWGALAGGITLAFGAVLAGGCGSGTIWRAGEGQVKLWLAIPFFAVSNSLMISWFQAHDFEGAQAWRADGTVNDGVLGWYLYMPDYIGYWGSVLLIAALMVAWYLIATWNEKTDRLVVEP
jgi:uncharacterized membrane protein YedE/YeeE